MTRTTITRDISLTTVFKSASGLLVMFAVAGCIPSNKPSFDSPAPNSRLDAIVEASDATDPESLANLVEQLDSDDPAARMLAITALRMRTGQTLGYVSADPIWKRGPALERWNEFISPVAVEEDPND